MEWTNLKLFLSDIMAEKLIDAMIIQWAIVGLFYLFCYIYKVKPSTMWSRYIVLGVALVITFLFAGLCFGYGSIDTYQFVRSCIF